MIVMTMIPQKMCKENDVVPETVRSVVGRFVIP